MEGVLGRLFQRNNSNCSVNGDNISGTVTDNSNLKVNCQSSTLTLKDNSNSSFSLANSDVTASSCSNSDVSGKGNKIKMKDNSNSSFNGDNNEVEMSSNSNFKLSGNNGRLKFFSNSNTTVKGNGNCIEAKDNSNLKIEGNGNQLKIADTFNHVVKIEEETVGRNGAASNVFEVIPNPSGQLSSIRGTSWMNSLFGNGNRTNYQNSNLRFLINYLHVASILSNHYELGIFKFKLEESKEPSTLNLRLDASEMDQGELNISCTGNDKCVISGSKGGDKQRLQIISPAVKQLLEVDPKLLSINF